MRGFNKLRRKAMIRNKSPRYLKYALGEIILVVIGILMALQINNWNLDRLERKSEQKILQSLKVEFEENQKDAQRVYDGYAGIVNAMSEIQLNSEKNKLTENEFDSLTYHVFDWFDFTPRPGASNNLVNSGNLSIIQNEALRGLLTIWSGIDEELDDDEKLAINYSQDIIIPFLAQNYPLSRLEKFDYTLEFYREKDLVFRKFEAETEFDMNILLQNTTFQSHVSVKKMYARHCAVEGIRVLEACKKILRLIETELDKKQL